jgi:hypothetical protein
MSLFDRLFGTASSADQPQLRFGRYTDSYKTPEQYAAWDQALEAFESEAFLESYRQFFQYLRDESEDNVRTREEESLIFFEIFQGSKRITGQASPERFCAEARVAYAHDLHIGFMRRLIEQNFDLKYSRYALSPDNVITVKFDTYSLDGSPYKLYYALKELSTQADKQDDLLLDEFEELQPVEVKHLEAIPTQEKQVKENYLRETIQRAIQTVESGQLDPNKYPGAMAYLLLDVVYRVDFLTKPEGFTMETLERIHREYFSKNQLNTIQKNHQMQKELEALLARPSEAFQKELYRVPSTFGITEPVNHEKVCSYIDGELPHMDWYQKHDHPEVALAIPGYIVGYCLFNYAIPKPDRDLFQLYYQIMEPAYFKALGYTLDYYDPKKGALNKRRIRQTIREIVDLNEMVYPDFEPDLGMLDFSDRINFARSFLKMVRALHLTKAI